MQELRTPAVALKHTAPAAARRIRQTPLVPQLIQLLVVRFKNQMLKPKNKNLLLHHCPVDCSMFGATCGARKPKMNLSSRHTMNTASILSQQKPWSHYFSASIIFRSSQPNRQYLSTIPCSEKLQTLLSGRQVKLQLSCKLYPKGLQ